MKGVILRAKQPHLYRVKTFWHRAVVEAYLLVIVMSQMVGSVDVRLGILNMHFRAAIGQRDQIAPSATREFHRRIAQDGGGMDPFCHQVWVSLFDCFGTFWLK